MSASTPTPRPLEPRDFDALRALLEACALTTSDLGRDRVHTFVGIFDAGALVASGGLETFGGDALLRSVAVTRARRGLGLGAQIVAHIEAHAKELGVGTLYLLTEDADAYFERLGYRRAARSEAPQDIATTPQFASLCSGSATLMRKRVSRG